MPCRNHNRNHCPVCEIFRPLCVCDALEDARRATAALRTRVIVIMHVREVTLPTNTARLAAAALPDCEIRLRGAIDRPLSAEGFADPSRQPLLLFPSDDAAELTPELVAGFGKPATLIVPDGNWRQARKVAGREPSLGQVPRVKLPPGPPSSYRLRKAPDERSVSTFEAIARALGVLEGPELGVPALAALQRAFDLRVERALWAKGKLKAGDCRYPIPEAAFESFRLAGAAGGGRLRS